ncbi:MAG: ABC transporter substrate-binding protein [Proteocatella sp.]
MEEKKVVKRAKKDITDTREKQKKIFFAIGIALFTVLYVFLLTIDTENTERGTKNQTQEAQDIQEPQEDTTKNPESMQAEYQNTKPVEGGTIKLSVSRFNTVNPLKNKEKSLNSVLRLVYDPLFEFDSKYNLKNVIAQSYSFNEDASELTITLDSGAKWHNGTKVTAEDAEYTINVLKKTPDSSYASLVSNIESVSSNGMYLTLKLKTPNVFEPYNLIFPIISQNSEINPKQILTDDKFGVIGNGMYKVVEYKKSKNFVLKKNENYNGKKPYIENIDVSIFDSKEIRQNMFIASNVDIIDSDYYNLSKYQYDIFRVQPYESRKFELIAFNCSKPPFDQKTNRVQLAGILDLKKIAEDAYREALNLNMMPINSKSGYNFVSENMHTIPKNQLKKTNVTKFKEKLVILTDKDDPMKHRLAYMIKNKIEALGISPEVTIKAVAKDQLESVIESQNYNIMIMEYNVPLDKDVTKLITKYNNILKYGNPEINERMAKIKSTPSKETHKAEYRALQQDIMKLVPFIGMGFKNDYIILNQKLRGNLEPTEIDIYNGIENIYISN